MQHFVHRALYGLFFLSVSLVFVVISEAGSSAVTVDRVIASVDNEIVTYADYQQFVKGLEEKPQGNKIDAGVLNNLIEEKIILLEAKRKGIEVSDDEVDKAVEDVRKRNGVSKEGLAAMLAGENMDFAVYKKFLKDTMTVSKMINLEVDSMVVVTDDEMEKYYHEHREDYLSSPETVELKAIYLKLNGDASITEITDLKLKALKIAHRLREGENFDLLTEEYSDEPLKSHEGILGKFARGKLIPPLDRAAFSLHVGEVSDPVWVGDGVYILKLTHKNGESFRPFESAKEDIYHRLFQQRREKLLTEWTKKLWEKSSVKIN